MRVIPLLLLAACSPSSEPTLDSTSPGEDTADSGETTPTIPASFELLDASLSETIPAVVVLSFEVQDGAGETFVRFGPTDEEPRWVATPVQQDDGRWRAVLVGCPPETRCSFELGRGGELDEPREITTGEGPSWATSRVETAGESSLGFVLTTTFASDGAALILDLQGRIVWWWTVPDREGGGLVTRASLAPDGRSIWFNQFDLGSTEPTETFGARLIQVALDGSSELLLPLPDNHHDFALLDDGSLVWLGLDEREIEGELVRADRLVQRAADGTDVEIWNGWDSLELEPGQLEFFPPTYWTLGNHLKRDGEDGWAMSFKNLDTIIAIDPEGQERWRLGQEEPALEPDLPFASQHGFTLLDDGVVLFDNQGSVEGSRLLEQTFDFDAERAETTWEHSNGDFSLILGDVLRLDNGHTLAAWGQRGLLEELDAAGETIFGVTLEHSDGSGPLTIGFLEYQESIGPR